MGMNVIGFLLYKLDNLRLNYMGKKNTFSVNNRGGVIGDNCLISYNVHIRTGMHNYQDKNMLIKDQGGSEKDVTIGDDVWIGFGAQIMPGVRIADGCVIGAGAVVTKDTEPYGVYGGVPAKIIKRRI